MRFSCLALVANDKDLIVDDGSEKSSAAGDKSSTPREEAAAGEDEENPSEPPFYDKSRSFFDRISCESLEKQEGYVY